MRTALLTVVIFGPLAALASNPERGLEGDIQDGPGTPTPGSFGDGTALYEQWPQLGSVPVNRTEGFIRREKRQPKNLLEARQTDVCLDPGYILVCPVTDPFPCCDPKFPICCHTSTCCPTGTFCVGQLSCCQLGTVACGEGCCPQGTTCCGNACCTPGFACVRQGECQSTNPTTSTSSTRSRAFTSAATFSKTGADPTSTDTPASISNEGASNPPNNAAVIGGAVGGTIGGLALIGVGVFVYLKFFAGAGAAGAAGAAGGAGSAGGLGNTGAAGAQGYGWTGGASGSSSVGQPLMTSTSTPFTPAATADGFAGQQPYGAPGSPYAQPLTPGTEYNQPLVTPYTQGWAGNQSYGQPAPDALASGTYPNYAAGSPPSSNTGGSAYGGAMVDTMQPGQPGQPGQVAFGGYESRASPAPQVQTWVERSGGN